MSTKQAESLVTIATAARETGVAYHTLRRMVLAGLLPYVTVAGRIRRVRISQVRALMAEHVAA